MNVTIIGTGYVGLVTGTCLSELGHTVTCIDINQEKITNLKKGLIPIYEPGLEELILKNVEQGRLFFSTRLSDHLSKSDIVFIAVGTPQDEKTGQADLQAVMACSKDIATHAQNHLIVVTKSTVPVDTHQKVAHILKTTNPSLTFDVVSNPEFLREGSAVSDFMGPDRVVVGTSSDFAESKMKELYAPLINHGVPFIFTTLPSAELIKYASNCFLATKISFINEMADLCEKTGAEINDVAHAMGLDARIGQDFLKTGPGYGGSCFPKDTRALAFTAQEYGAPLSIVDAVIVANEARKEKMAERINKIASATSSKTLALLGVAFKAETDDIRESPALPIIYALLESGYTLRIHDPEALNNAKSAFPQADITWCDTSHSALEEADACVIITEWKEYKDLDLKKCAALLNNALLIDLRNLFDPTRAADAGLAYIPLGSKHPALD